MRLEQLYIMRGEDQELFSYRETFALDNGVLAHCGIVQSGKSGEMYGRGCASQTLNRRFSQNVPAGLHTMPQFMSDLLLVAVRYCLIMYPK